MSSYQQVEAGPREVRLVAADAADCGSPIVGTGSLALSSGKDRSYTLVFGGEAAGAPKIAIVEDRGAPASGMVGY